MSFLDQVKKPSPDAPVITIAGHPGAGKTSLAARFPNPIFVQAEKSGTTFENWDDADMPSLFPELPAANKKKGISTKKYLLEQLRELLTEEHQFKTVVFDTVSSLNDLFEREIVEFDNNEIETIGEACGGYNKGYDKLASMHAEVRRACEHLRSKGMAIVFLSHVGVTKHRNRPDAQEYTSYSLDLPVKSASQYIKHSDAVLYLKSVEYVTGTETNRKGQTTKFGRITTTGERILITSSDGIVGYTDAKNRYQMPQEIDVVLGENPILQYIKFFNK